MLLHAGQRRPRPWNGFSFPWEHAAVELDGSVAIVTGAGSGIGRATTLAFARAGATAVAADIDERAAAETVGLVHDAGGRASSVRVDVTEPRSVEAMFAAAERDHGGVDIVHNNAGLVSGEPLWPDITPETLLRVMNVNLGGVVLGTRLAVPVLRRRGGGAIVNTASMAALFPLTADPIYSATKAGVTMFTRACAPLAEEGIRVNAVLPGLVDTPLLAKSGDGDRWADWAYAAQDVMGLLDADDVAAVVLDLVRDDTAVAEERIVGSIPAAQDPSS
jgi:NAD(P)-dependent dehydrogenase (short-subunit alcohol dehydrogenase family)